MVKNSHPHKYNFSTPDVLMDLLYLSLRTAVKKVMLHRVRETGKNKAVSKAVINF